MPAIERTREAGKLRLAILVNTIAPYRIPIYEVLANYFDVLVLHGGNERNRTWALDVPPSVKTRKVWTLQIPVRKETGVGGVWDTQYLHLSLGLLWWLPRFRPGAILTNELGLRTMVALLYGRLTGVPVWVQWEGTLHSERHIGKLKHWMRRGLARMAGKWVSYGATSSEYLQSLGVPDSRVVQVQNCVPHESFARLPDQASKDREQTWFAGQPRPVLLSVGQLIPRKGLDRLIDACGRLASRGHTFSLVLVGHGPERERLEEQAGRLGLRHFHILPNQDQLTLSRLYRSAGVFVLPTLEDVWGLVVSEAIWSGLPVLCSRYAGCAEIVDAEHVFDPMSDESFDSALAKVFGATLHATNPGVLMTCRDVGQLIGRAILRGTPLESTTETTRRVLTGADRPG